MQTLVKPESRKRDKPKKEPKFHVVLHNDDYNTFDHVIGVLVSVLGVSAEQALRFTFEAHHTGQAIVFTGSLLQAELKKDQILGHAIDPHSCSDVVPTRLIASLQKSPD